MLILTLEILRFCLLINPPMTYGETVERELLTLPTSGTQQTHLFIKCYMKYYIIRNSYFLPERKNKIK